MVRRIIVSTLAALCLATVAPAAEIKTIDLKPYVGYSPFDIIKADWLLPRGDHVFDGVPWKIDGVILLYGKNSGQKTNAARTIVDIPIGQSFDKLHLLAAAQQTSPDKTVIAKIYLNYADGSKATIDIRFGEHVRYYMRNWHHDDKRINDKSVHEAWHGQFEPVSNHDQYLRLFHLPFANPDPSKEVRSITFESTKQNAALMVAAMSIGPANAAPLPNDVLGKGKFPDLRKRTGVLETGEGYVYSDEGKPVANALVKIIAARNYDSGELNESPPATEAKTDNKGHFALTGLPDDFAYRVLILADGFEPFAYHGLDVKSDAIQLRLERATVKTGTFAIRARLVTSDDKPVASALVECAGVGNANYTTFSNEGFPEYFVSDTNGEFVLARAKEFDRVQVKVAVPGLAPAQEWITFTNTVTAIKLGVGATISGRVLDLNGEPIPNARLGIAGTDRNSEVFAGSYFTTTHADGTFAFEHVRPLIKWSFFGTFDSFKKFGALRSRSIMSGTHGESSNMGDLPVIPGLRLSGRIKTHHGEPLPKALKLRLSIEDTSDSQMANSATNGQFSFTGLYPGSITLYLESETWRLGPLNRSMSLWNDWEMVGMMEKNKDDLVVEIEEGKRNYVYENNNGNMPNSDEPNSKEIAGVENLEGTLIVISGSVVGDKTGTPITQCKIVPGYKPTAAAMGFPVVQTQKSLVEKLLQPLQKKQPNWWERPFWMPGRAEKITNGTFSIPFVPRQSLPILRVEAKGYEPVVTEGVHSSTNIVIRLSSGNGPNGTVLMPDGKPADQAQVLFAAVAEQNGLDGFRLNFYGSDTAHSTNTGPEGKFSFMARNDASTLYAVHQSGYGEVPVVRDQNPKFDIQLKPWAWIIGTLKNSNGTPATGVELGLTLYNGMDWDSTQSLLHFNHEIKTDSKGFFLFSNVPPRRVQVQRIIRTGRGGWTSVLQTWLEVEPGITNDLATVTYDQPPAKPVIEQIKQKLGLH